MKTIFKTIAIITIAASFTACTQMGFDDIEPIVNERIVATTTIAQLKANFMDTSFVFFGANRIISDQQVVINGIITSTDVEGNIFSYIVIQEERRYGQAIRVSMDVRGLASAFPLGQRVAVIANGLYIGQSGQSPQIGILGRHRTRTSEPEQIAAIPLPIARLQVIPYGKPDPSAVIPDTMTIAQILAADQNALVHRLVYIRNVHFTGRDDRGVLSDENKIFAPGTDGRGFPQRRQINDGTGSINIATSEFALFASRQLPALTDTGSITALVGWHNTSSPIPSVNRQNYYQLTLRTLGDLGSGFERYLESVNYVPGGR